MESISENNPFQLLLKPLRSLLEKRGFSEPTPPQRFALPKILEGKNVLLIAPSGSGKTEGAFLPVLHLLLLSQPEGKGVRILYLTPLRALNRDMLERLEWWCRALDLKVAVRHGDTLPSERQKQALVPPEVLITTPESLQILLAGRRLSGHLKTVRWVIVDEVHELADNKRGAQLSLSLERLRALCGDFQIVGLSATIGSPEEVARFLVGEGRECEVVDVSMEKEMELGVVYPKPTEEDRELASKLYTFPEVAARLREIRRLMETHGSTLLFTNTRPMAEILANRFKLWDVKFPVSVHHGSLSSFSRVRAERGLKEGEVKGLVSTSSLELGLDIGRVDLVIQYNSPRQVTRLLQRVGRSGHRLGKVAKGIVVVQDPDDMLEAMVILSHARRKELEPVKVPEKPLDVLLHSLASLLLRRRRVEVEEVVELFRKAYPFRGLGKEEVLKVVEFAQGLSGRFLRLSEDGKVVERAGPPARLFQYYFENLSMIPDLKQYLVVDDESGQPVGVLDDSFMAEYGEPGVKFTLGGEIWKIVQVFSSKVYVKRDEDPVGAVPSWIGEEIPVPFSVAQEVGRIRRRVEEAFLQGRGEEEVRRELAREYGVEEGELESPLSEMFSQLREGLPLPTDRRVVVEKVGEFCVVGACFGTLVNRTLARFLAQTLSSELVETVASRVDPYRLVLRSPSLDPERVVSLLRRGREEDLREIVEGSRFFRWRLVQVARRMGVLRKEVELTHSLVDKLMVSLKGTPVFEETFKEVVQKDLDLERTAEVLRLMRSGEIEVKSLGERDHPTPLSYQIWRQHRVGMEPAVPGRLRLLVVASARARLLGEVRTFACVSCRSWFRELPLHELEERPRCPRCGSAEIGMAEEPEEEVRKAAELAERGREGEVWKKVVESARLLSRYGRLAALALAGRHITPKAAEEILKREREFSTSFIERVLEKEREEMLRRWGK
ncbi:MAG: DEAD/DEAH box helicase [Candidatus Hadarchaeales archaeon]